MPIYEFKCLDCNAVFSVLCSVSHRDESVACERCSSSNTGRRISRFKTVRSEDRLLESMTDPSMLSGIDEKDPRSVAGWAKKMAREMGEDIGDEIEAMAEEELSGASEPESDESAADSL